MANWQQILAPLVSDVEKHFDTLKYRLAYMLGGPDPIKIVPYRGYGTSKTLYLKGRVLEDQGITPPRDNDTLWDNLLNMYKRLESDEVPRARLRARCQESERVITADEEGMFELQMQLTRPLPERSVWHPVEFTLLEPVSDEQKGPVQATGWVLVPPPNAEFGVISDIDDTVVQTDATNLVRMARTVFMGNARTRLPFPGVAAFYRALYAGARHPLFYVSNTLWNLYDLMYEFFRIQQIPVGPMLLRNWGIYEDELLPTQQRKHKQPTIRRILDTYPTLPFILIGDSGEADPEIYCELIQAYPGRVLAVYIRDVERDTERSSAIRKLAEQVLQAGSTLVLAEDSLTMARHAAEQGWIETETLPTIAAERAKDEGSPGVSERLLGEGIEAN
jgi:phosphatidate phosphatase APP1